MLFAMVNTHLQNARLNYLLALQPGDECGGLGDLLGWPLNKYKEMHCNANDVFGLCHVPRYAEDVCEHTLIN